MQIFEKLTEIPMNTWIALAAIVIFGVVLLAVGRRVKWNAKMLACGALCIAMSFVLSYIRLLHMPQGGSITPASMLPVMLAVTTCPSPSVTQSHVVPWSDDRCSLYVTDQRSLRYWS